jgi:Ca2+-dependent lipid-binding protein
MPRTTEKVQISIHAQTLKNVAGAFKGKSDPYAVVTLIASEPGQQPTILGKTEVIKNNLSPHWVKTFEIDYEFSKQTRINVGVYDEIRKAKNAKPMGTAVFEVGEVLGARGNIKAKKIKDGGTIFCRIQKSPEVHAGTFHFQLRGIKLKNVGTYSVLYC